MKQFFEEYGGVALGILALLVLIAMITPVGNIVKTSLQGTVNKFSSSMNGQLDSAMNATSEAQNNALDVISGNEGDPVTPSFDLSNINKSGVVGNFSTKGNLVEINGTQYRVLEVNGTQAKVMSMDNAGNSIFNSSGTRTYFGDEIGQKYASSDLDNAMTSYYNSLPSAIQNAIVEQNINQSMYSWSSGTNASASFSAWSKNPFTDADTTGNNYYLTRMTDINVGVRKVYALDIDDVITYLGSNSTPQDVNELFWNQRSSKPYEDSTDSRVWLRSALEGEIFATCVNGYYGYLNHDFYNSISEVRPAFVIDLSLL